MEPKRAVRSSVKGSKPAKTNWVMYQYHLGTEEDEKDGQYVVSKIFYQQHNQADKNNNFVPITEHDKGTTRTSPKTPKTNTPNPPRSRKYDVMDDYILESPIQVGNNFHYFIAKVQMLNLYMPPNPCLVSTFTP